MNPTLDSTLQAAITERYGVTDPDIAWELQEKDGFGDVATAVALKLAKQAGKPPREIAEELAVVLSADSSVAKVEVAGPGYVNVTFTSNFLVQELNTVPSTLEPTATKTSEQPVIVEYSQPNIAKPLGVHHLLSTVIGQAIANLYRFGGYNVIAWNYLGDYGTQFGKLAVAIQEFGDMNAVASYSLDDLLQYYVKFHEEAERDPVLEEKAREAFKKLEEGNAQLTKFWQQVVKTTKEALSELYEDLHVHFDIDYGESFYQDKMDSVLEAGKQKGVFVEGKEGALIVEFTEESGMPPYLVQKGDGATLYSTRDITQMQYRINEFDPQKILIVTDIAQKLHFEQLEETCNRLGYSMPYFENVLVGRMRFADKSMSTRKGNILKLKEVIAEAKQQAMQAIESHGDAVQTDDPKHLAKIMGVGALSYGILSQNRSSDIVFDWDKFLSFDGNSAPYVQYTHARARSILRRAGNPGFTPISNFVSELTPKERALLRTLSRWDQVITQARESHLPHLLCTYLYTLCQTFNSFYSVEPILEADDAQKVLRLNLCYLTAEQLRTGAELLTIEVPEMM